MLHAADSIIDAFFKAFLTVNQNHYLLSSFPKAFLMGQPILSLFWLEIPNTSDDKICYEPSGLGMVLAYLFIKMRNPSVTTKKKSKQ
jgi:hypothetical protein